MFNVLSEIDCAYSWQKISLFMTLKFTKTQRDYDPVCIQVVTYNWIYTSHRLDVSFLLKAIGLVCLDLYELHLFQ